MADYSSKSTDSVDDNSNSINAELNQNHEIDGDNRIEPDTDLKGYQDDLATGDKDDIPQYDRVIIPLTSPACQSLSSRKS